MMSDDDLLELGAKVHKVLKRTSAVACVGLGFNDGTVRDTGNYYCHAGLRKISIDKTLAVITNKIQLDYSGCIGKKEMEKYYNYLLNDSPFADCFITKTLDDALNRGITLRTTLPANLVCAAAITTRQAWEHSDVATSLNNMIGFGIEPRKAHIAAHLVRVSSKGEFRPRVYNYHVGVYASQFSKESIKNFLSGTLPKTHSLNTKPYREVLSYTDLCRMWGRGGELRIRGGVGNDVHGINPNPFNLIVNLGGITGREGKRMDVVEAVEGAIQ